MTVCPWSNVEGDDDFEWKLSTSNLTDGAVGYDITGSSVGKMADI